MRIIDADELFNEAFKVWGVEADAGETSIFMDMINNSPTIPQSPNQPLTLEELKEMKELLEYAERSLEEAIKNGTASDIDYWRGYRDAVKRIMENEQKN